MKSTSSLYHLSYISQATAPFGEAQLRLLLASSRQRNTQRGITGLLLHGNDQFFQVLEGEPGTLSALYERICRDPRHREVTLLVSRPLAERRFANWSMGGLLLPAQQFIDFAGYATHASRLPDPALADEQLAQLLRQVLAG